MPSLEILKSIQELRILFLAKSMQKKQLPAPASILIAFSLALRENVHAVQFHPEKSGEVGLSILHRFLYPNSSVTKPKKPVEGKASKLAKKVIACLDVRANDNGDLVVTKGYQYDVRENTKENEVRNLGKLVELVGQYFEDGVDEVLRYASENVFVPLTVGGGIRDFTDSNDSESNL